MKAKIWKYEIPAAGEFEIAMPGAAQIMSLQIQNGKPHIWALVKPDFVKSLRKFVAVGTGHDFEVERSDKFIGTFQMGDYVGHLFELNR